MSLVFSSVAREGYEDSSDNLFHNKLLQSRLFYAAKFPIRGFMSFIDVFPSPKIVFMFFHQNKIVEIHDTFE